MVNNVKGELIVGGMTVMYSEIDNKKKTAELEGLYNQRLEEFRTSQDKVNRLEATIAVNSEKFLELYSNLNPTLVKNYGLELTKDLKEMNEQEVQELLNKTQEAFNKIYVQLERYLRTGEVEHVEAILTAQQEDQNKLNGNNQETVAMNGEPQIPIATNPLTEEEVKGEILKNNTGSSYGIPSILRGQ